MGLVWRLGDESVVVGDGGVAAITARRSEGERAGGLSLSGTWLCCREWWWWWWWLRCRGHRKMARVAAAALGTLNGMGWKLVAVRRGKVEKTVVEKRSSPFCCAFGVDFEPSKV